MSLIVEPVETAAALDEFIRLPPRLYGRFPEYVPPLTMEKRGIFDPKKAPFHKHGVAQYWIARRGGEAIGRISAQIDHAQPPGLFEDAGLFGSLDAIDDGEAVFALTEVAEQWLREQGRMQVLGPCTLSMNEEPGLLVAGQAEPPLIGVQWHPAYLAGHLGRCGYEGVKDMHFWRCQTTPEKFKELRGRPSVRSRLADYTTRKLNTKDLRGEIEVVRQVYNDAWQGNWGFVPLQPHDLDAVASDLKPFLRPEHGVFVEHDGKPVGVAMVIPNLFEITSDIDPDPSLIGWGKLGWRTLFHRFRTGRIILLGVLSKFHHSVGGAVIAMSLVDEIIERFLKYEGRADWIEAGWVLEDNAALIRLLEQFGFSRTRTLRMLQKNIAISSGPATSAV